MSFVNSSLLNTGGVPSNPGPETIPAGQTGDLNQEFSQMLQYLRQGQGSKEQDEAKQGVSKEDLSKEHFLNPEAPMKNLMGFLESLEGQLAKDFGRKSSEANVTLETAPVEDKLTALAQFLSILQEKLTEDPRTGVEKIVAQTSADIGNLDLDELAGLLKEVKAFFDQVTDPAQFPILSDEIKALPLISAGTDALEDEAIIMAPDTSASHRDASGTPLAISEMKVDEDPEKKSQSLIAKGLSNALSKLQAFVSKVKSAPNNTNDEVIASNPDASKVSNILDALKGIDLNKLFTNLDKSSAIVDIVLDGTNQPTIDEVMTILNKVKSENSLSAPIKSSQIAQVSIPTKTVAEDTEPLALHMRTSDVVFVSQSDLAGIPIKNFPQSLRETSLQLERLTGETATVNLSSKVAKVSNPRPIEIAITEADVEAKLVRVITGKSDEEIGVKSGQALAQSATETYIKAPIQTTDTYVVSEVKAAEELHPMSPKQVVAKPIEQVVTKPIEQVVTKPIEQVVTKPIEQVVTKPIEQVTTKPIEQMATKTIEQMATKPIEQVVTKSPENSEAQEIKPLPKVVENTVQSFPARDISEIKVDVETTKVPVEQTTQVTDKFDITSTKLNLKPIRKNNTTEVPDGGLKTAFLEVSGKEEKTDAIHVAKGDMSAQPKTLYKEIAFKELHGVQEHKVAKPASVDVNEVRPEFTAKKLESAEASQKADTGKVEAKLSSNQGKRNSDDILKDNSNLEKVFAKIADKGDAAKQAVPAQKAQQNQVKHTFYIEPPKIKHHSTGQNTPLDSKAVTDFVARTTQALVAQQQGFTRKKSVADASATSSAVGVNADAVTSQQITASSGSQSQAGQNSSGSNMLEKWADSHLDLSSRGWAMNMAKTMVSALNRGRERLMFSLSPPSLGRISIAFTSTRGALDVRIQAERKATISLLGDAEGKLMSNLESAGHRVNSLSYAEMNSGETKFDFDHKQSSNNENRGKGKSDSPEAEKSAKLETDAESSAVQNKKADDSLVNITV